MIDIRKELVRTDWSMKRRNGKPTSITLHYNGPPVQDRSKAGELKQLKADAQYHIDHLKADGIQYHFAVGSDGSVYVCRDIEYTLWHCANKVGNDFSIAVHLPLGGAQDATEVQWLSTTKLFDNLIYEYGMLGTSVVFGHREWKRYDGKKQGSCPGDNLFKRLVTYRSADSIYEIISGIDFAAVREGPGTKYKISGKFYTGDRVFVDVIKSGDLVHGDRQWAHLSKNNTCRDLGFIHMSLLRKIS